MTLDPLTFILEILNFLVLLWLLQRFLYKPIKAAIAQRQLVLEQGLRDAQLRERAATAREQEYQSNLEQWEVEKVRQQAELQQSLMQEREKTLVKVREAADAEKTRLQTLSKQDFDAQEQHSREQAVKTALHLTRRMLDRLAGKELDQMLLHVMAEDLPRLTETEVDEIRSSLAQQKGKVTVASAHPLTEGQLQGLQQALSRLLNQDVHCETTLEPELISGVRVSIGARVLHANLGDELAFFQLGLNFGTP